MAAVINILPLGKPLLIVWLTGEWNQWIPNENIICVVMKNSGV